MTAQTVTDTDSIAKFGVQSTSLDWPHSDLLLTDDDDVLALVTEVLAQQKDDFIGISSIDVDADQAPETLYALLSQLASAGIGKAAKFGIRWVHPSGNELDETVRLIGLSGNITMEGEQAKMTMNLRTARDVG